MHLRQLQYLRLVIEKGSHAAAAAAAGVSQPTVTLAMQSLERELGVALFEKVGRRKLATRAALAVAQRAAEVHDKIDAMALPPGGADWPVSATPGSLLRVGTSPAAAQLYGPVIERVWHAQEREGVLQILGASAHELLAALQAKELDLVIAPRPRGYQVPGIRRLVLHTSIPGVYCRMGHPLAGATSLKEISGAAWAVTGRAGTPGSVIEEAHRVRGLDHVRVLLQCLDYTTLLHLVMRSDMFCVVPHPLLLAGVAQDALRRVPIKEGLPRYEVSMFWWSDRHSPHSRLLRTIAETLAAQRG